MRFREKTHTLSGRLALTISVVTALCLLMLITVSYRAIRSTERARLESTILSDAAQLSDQLRQEYLSLVHISQQMMPLGSVGYYVEGYLDTSERYDRIVHSKLVSETLNLTTFSNPQVELVMYYSVEGSDYRVLFSNNSAKESFDAANFSILSQTADIKYQALHVAESRFSNANVVSLTRRVVFSDDVERYIYVETRSSVPRSVQEMSRLQGIPYGLLQLDRDGIVRYSTMEEYPVGMALNLTGAAKTQNTGRIGNHTWARATSSFGFTNVLLIPTSGRYRQMEEWLLEISLVAIISAALIAFLSFFLRGQVYRPLKVLSQEMTRFGSGEMDVQEFQFGIQEYNALFAQFNMLKGQIGSLMDDIYRGEQEKRQLELDKLYFQINPHFIMNALNSAHWQAHMHAQKEIAEYLSRLNYLLGYTLGKVSVNTTIRSEIQVLMAYLELQQSRHDFQVWSDVEDGLYLERPCARLILQPIAENAVCHCIDDFGNLWIEVREVEGRAVKVVLRDDGAGFDPAELSFREPPEIGTERETHKGIGLRYVWLSLEAFYGGAATMEVESAPGQGTTITLALPHPLG
ncbi:histidine kinase [Ruminococcaceae bacterium OttesenSCG-928-L11]|nr:histidine kinase [Ruminococcaceae bacterium OttesenSCG-928-L11]